MNRRHTEADDDSGVRTSVSRELKSVFGPAQFVVELLYCMAAEWTTPLPNASTNPHAAYLAASS